MSVDAGAVQDQYADGRAARVWELYTGAKQSRTTAYREWICDALRGRGVKTILDVACGTGVDSIMLVEEGFKVVSIDLSDKMLKYALKERWERRNDPAFNDWIIAEGNWLSLLEDVEDIEGAPIDGFDAVVCLGNSFAHLPDITGDQKCHYQAIHNMASCLKEGGVLIIDHRNYDAILDTGKAPQGKNVYYPSDHIISIATTTSYTDNVPSSIQLNYTMDMTAILRKDQMKKIERLPLKEQREMRLMKFSLSYYPHRLSSFQDMLKSCFGKEIQIDTYGDFQPIRNDYCPAYFIHMVTRKGEVNGLWNGMEE